MNDDIVSYEDNRRKCVEQVKDTTVRVMQIHQRLHVSITTKGVVTIVDTVNNELFSTTVNGAA